MPGPLLRPRGARRGVEAVARPAAVLRVRGREVAVDLGEVGVEAPARALELPLARDHAAAATASSEHEDTTTTTMSSQVGTRADYSSTSRERRCAPTLRFTRWSALSTVLQSQPSCSPMPV